MPSQSWKPGSHCATAHLPPSHFAEPCAGTGQATPQPATAMRAATSDERRSTPRRGRRTIRLVRIGRCYLFFVWLVASTLQHLGQAGILYHPPAAGGGRGGDGIVTGGSIARIARTGA